MNKELIIDKKDIRICPEYSGVYWLYKKSYNGWNIVYIGISNNIKCSWSNNALITNFPILNLVFVTAYERLNVLLCISPLLLVFHIHRMFFNEFIDCLTAALCGQSLKNL